jgi:Tfp pilus assembly protein PilN
MRQINLASQYNQLQKGASIHPFWKNFAIITVICTFLSLGFPIYYYTVLADYKASLGRMEHRALELKPMAEQFNQAAQTNRLLKQEIQLLKNQTDSDQFNNSLYMNSHPKINQTMQELIESMPDEVWLQKIDCDYPMQTVILTGSTTTKDEFQKFLDHGLMQRKIFHNLSIQYLKRVENQKELQFQISVQFFIKTGQESNSEK